MQLKSHEINIWTIELVLTPAQIEQYFSLLDKDERARANRYQSPIHRERFIAAHAALRNILGGYLDLAPSGLAFAYTEHKKPYLPEHPRLQFNLSHSHDLALVGCTLDHKIGVDVEKIGTNFNLNVAKRFFSSQENNQLISLPDSEQTNEFYRLWARKEALIKAIGKGIAALPLASFSVTGKDETLSLEDETWSLMPLNVHADYQAAVASNQPIKHLTYCQFINHTSS